MGLSGSGVLPGRAPLTFGVDGVVPTTWGAVGLIRGLMVGIPVIACSKVQQQANSQLVCSATHQVGGSQQLLLRHQA